MLRLIFRISGLAALLLVASAALAQTEFSADVVNNGGNAKQKNSKVYFGKDKIRFEGKDASDPRGSGAVIFDLASESWTVIADKQHMYMVMPSSMMESRGMFSFFKSGDVENACVEWLKQETNKGGTCHKDGREVVNGRSTVKYSGTNAKGEPSSAWFDSKLRFPVKWDGKNGGELQNIQEGPQPSSLFDMPAGYTKMDMGGMMMKQHN